MFSFPQIFYKLRSHTRTLKDPLKGSHDGRPQAHHTPSCAAVNHRITGKQWLTPHSTTFAHTHTHPLGDLLAKRCRTPARDTVSVLTNDTSQSPFHLTHSMDPSPLHATSRRWIHFTRQGCRAKRSTLSVYLSTTSCCFLYNNSTQWLCEAKLIYKRTNFHVIVINWQIDSSLLISTHRNNPVVDV